MDTMPRGTAAGAAIPSLVIESNSAARLRRQPWKELIPIGWTPLLETLLELARDEAMQKAARVVLVTAQLAQRDANLHPGLAQRDAEQRRLRGDGGGDGG